MMITPGPVEHRLPIAGPDAVRRGATSLIRADGRAFVGLILINVLAAAAGLIAPWLVGRLIDRVDNGSAGVAEVDRIALILICFALAQLILLRTARVIGARFGERTAARLREQFVDRVLSLPAREADRSPAGDLAARGTGDVDRVTQILRDAAPEIVISVIQMLIIFTAVMITSPLLGAIGVVGLVGISAALRWYFRRAHRAYLELGAVHSSVGEMLSTTALGARTIETLGLQDLRRRECADTAERGWWTSMRTLRLRSVLFPTVDLSSELPAVAALLLGGLLHAQGVISLGTVVASVLYLRQLAAPVDAILLWMEALPGSAASYARVEGLAALQPPPVGDLADPAPLDERLAVRSASFAYEKGHDVLLDVSLDVRSGEHLAIVGASGAGKTTLGRLLSGLDSPRTGLVTIGGVPVDALAPERLRRQVVLVTQDHYVFRGTIRDNLLIADQDASDDDLQAALFTVGAHWAVELPNGLDTMLGDDDNLDGGQAQQLSLARVVLADPHTLILDEATALLDPTTARTTERALGAALRGRTVIAIAHRLGTAHDSDRVAVMAEGRITEIGSHDQLLAADEGYADLWRSWHGDL